MGCCYSKRPHSAGPDIGVQSFAQEAIDCGEGLVVRTCCPPQPHILTTRQLVNSSAAQVRVSAAGYLTRTPLAQQLAVYTGEDVTLLALLGTGTHVQAEPAEAVRVFKASLQSSLGEIQEALELAYVTISGGSVIGRQASITLPQCL